MDRKSTVTTTKPPAVARAAKDTVTTTKLPRSGKGHNSCKGHRASRGEPVSWGSPKVGDLLRHDTTHATGPCRIKRVEALLHVLAVFEHEGSTRVVTAERAGLRWHYEIFDEVAALYGKIWPDGEPRPRVL
jgi:hypothetical protein